MPESVYDRLQLLAIKRRTTVSAVAASILRRNAGETPTNPVDRPRPSG